MNLRGDTLFVRGEIGLERESAPLAVAIRNPPRYAGIWLRRALEAAGIAVRGNVRVSFEPVVRAGFEPVGTHESATVREIARRVLDESDNLGAECLARHMIARGDSTSIDALHERGFPDVPEARVVDGSGLSRTNLLAPRHLVWTLLDAATEADLRFADLLPVVADHEKLSSHPMAERHGERVAAKTGSFQDTRCLAGYYMDEEGEPAYAFAILLNGITGDESGALAFEAAIMDAIVSRPAE